jgi:NTE family protein
MTRIGIALGAGGAKGIAHIPMLEVLDELGVVPTRIAGCSIGAVIGALYASGLPAVEIKHMIAGLAITRSDTVRGVFAERKLARFARGVPAEPADGSRLPQGMGGLSHGPPFLAVIDPLLRHHLDSVVYD